MQADPTQIDRRTLLQNALVTIDKLQAKLDAVEQARYEPIAIIGLSCRFPGGANNPEKYWELLCSGQDAIKEVPVERWKMADYADLLPDGTPSWYGGFLDQVDQFDPQFFGIAPREAETMDPQQRLVLEMSWEALERAGQAPDKLKGSQTGIFIGITTNDYFQLAKLNGPAQMDVYTATGSALNVAPGRVAYTLGFQGPSVAVDTACSSSLVAVHLACQSLRNRESDLALAGGVNVLLTPEPFICFSRWGMMAPDGRCKTFDASADGFVRSEGCGVIVLKRLSDALAAGDNILALIRSSAVNQDGRSSGLTVPNGLAQQLVVRKALANARLRPADVTYIETHGTGTSLGDPIEIEALGAVLGEGRPAGQPLFVASVKTNIGHLESASGIAGLIKVVLSMQHRMLAPHLHLQERSPRIPWPNFPVIIPTEQTPWAVQNGPRIAGVSSFGFSGTNAHVILEEAPIPEPKVIDNDRSSHILTLSAKTEPALRQLAAHFAGHLAAQPSLSAADVAYTANTGRAQFNHRLAVVADSAQQMQEQLAGWAGGQAPAGVSSQSGTIGRPKIAFLFTGQGAQYVQMGRQLYDTQPTFRQTLEKCDEILRPYLDQPLLFILYPDLYGTEEKSKIDQTAYTQPALFALEYALAELWRSWGIVPSAVLGHSVGEYAAACLAGVFSLEDGLRLIAGRARLMQALPAGGEMAAVFADQAQVTRAIQPYADKVSIAAINGPQNIVISGAGEVVQTILANLAGQGIKAQRLTVSHAFHSPLMEPMLDDFTELAASLRYAAPQLGLVSNLTGQLATEETTTAAYWRQHVRAPVRFAESIRFLKSQGHDLFIEIGPKPTLLSLGQRCWVDEDGQTGTVSPKWLPSLRAGRADWQQMLESLGELYLSGIEINWTGFERDYLQGRQRLALPTYPFQRQRYWLEQQAVTITAPRSKSRSDKTQHPLLGSRLDLASAPDTYIWQNELDLNQLRYLDDHRVQGVAVVPATAYMEMAMAAAVEVFGPGSLTISNMENKKILTLSEATPPPLVQVVLSSAGGDLLSFQVFSRVKRLDQVHRPNDPWTLHVSGSLRHDPNGMAAAAKPFDLEAIQTRCQEQISGHDFYQKLSEKGNQWGPCFQGVKQVWRGNGEALSLVRVPEMLETEVDFYQFHPALSDTCGHVLTSTISLEKSDSSKGGAFVGGGVDETRVYQHPQGLQLWAYARLRQGESRDENILIGDVHIMDETGALVSETIGARLWYLDHQQQRTLLENLDDWFYEIQWQPQDRQAVQPMEADDKGWLIFADSQGVGQALHLSLKEQGKQCLLVAPGIQYEKSGDGCYIIRPERPEDWSQFLQDTVISEQWGAFNIVHLWSLDIASPEAATIVSLEAAQRLGCTSILYLTQALAQFKWSQAPRMWLVTQGAQAVADQDKAVAFAQAPLWGLGRTLITEFSEFWGGLIDLDPGMTASVSAHCLAQEIKGADSEDQLAIRREQRYVARLVHKRQFSPSPIPTRLRIDGSYLITGGLGGLGLQVAAWLVNNGARHLILMGRTKLPARSEWNQVDMTSRTGQKIAAIQALEALGAAVHLAPVDVADEMQLRTFLDQFAQEGWPPLRGVIHAAGIMQYQSLLEHQATELDAIFRPKVKGGWLLHHLLKDAPLEFFVLFSSASAVLSSPLIGSYAAANAFLDGLAHYRTGQGLPALSINWGLWAEVGMGADFDKGDRAESAGGLGLITPEQGLKALDRLLQQNSPQVSVMPINWEHWQKLYPAFTASPLLAHLIQERTDSSSSSDDSKLTVETLLTAEVEKRQEMLELYLSNQVASILKLPVATLDIQEPITNLGFDSLMALELKNRIETDLDVVTPMVQILQGPSTHQLTGWILDNLPEADTLQSSAGATVVPQSSTNGDHLDIEDAAAVLASLDQLSDEQVDLLLANLLAENEDN
jgi:acyl transferase domain-containing protein